MSEAFVLSRFPLSRYLFFFFPYLPLSLNSAKEWPHFPGTTGSYVLPPPLLRLPPFDRVSKSCCCFLKLQLSKQTGQCAREIRRQTSSGKYFIRTNTFEDGLGPRNFTFRHEMSIPTKGPLRHPERAQKGGPPPSSLAVWPGQALGTEPRSTRLIPPLSQGPGPPLRHFWVTYPFGNLINAQTLQTISGSSSI